MTAWPKWWRRHGPTFRWNRFRLYGRNPTGKWIPIRITQIVGGRYWSISITRTGPVQHDRQETPQ